MVTVRYDEVGRTRLVHRSDTVERLDVREYLVPLRVHLGLPITYVLERRGDCISRLSNLSERVSMEIRVCNEVLKVFDPLIPNVRSAVEIRVMLDPVHHTITNVGDSWSVI